MKLPESVEELNKLTEEEACELADQIGLHSQLSQEVLDQAWDRLRLATARGEPLMLDALEATALAVMFGKQVTQYQIATKFIQLLLR